MWASKTKAIPSSFPKPAPLALPPAQQQPPLQLPLQQQQQMQFQPQQQQQQMPQMQFQQQQMPQMQTQMQQQMQMQQQQQMQLMVNKGDIFTALPSDWMRMLDTLPDGELQGAISGFCGWLHQAYNLQNQEMKASKRLLEATRLVSTLAPCPPHALLSPSVALVQNWVLAPGALTPHCGLRTYCHETVVASCRIQCCLAWSVFGLGSCVFCFIFSCVLQLDKVEQKLAEKKQREHELRLVLAKSGELMAGHEKEYHVKEQQLLAASNDVASAKAMVEAARDRDAKERIGMERLIAGEGGRRGCPAETPGGGVPTGWELCHHSLPWVQLSADAACSVDVWTSLRANTQRQHSSGTIPRDNAQHESSSGGIGECRGSALLLILCTLSLRMGGVAYVAFDTKA